MDNRQTNSTGGTLGSMADDLKSGAANGNAIFSDATKQATDTAAEKANTVGDDISEFASAATNAGKKGAEDIGRAASNAASNVVAGAKGAASDAAAEVSKASANISHAANDGLDSIRNKVAANPIKALALAATVGFIAAVLSR